MITSRAPPRGLPTHVPEAVRGDALASREEPARPRRARRRRAPRAHSTRWSPGGSRPGGYGNRRPGGAPLRAITPRRATRGRGARAPPAPTVSRPVDHLGRGGAEACRAPGSRASRSRCSRPCADQRRCRCLARACRCAPPSPRACRAAGSLPPCRGTSSPHARAARRGSPGCRVGLRRDLVRDASRAEQDELASCALRQLRGCLRGRSPPHAPRRPARPGFVPRPELWRGGSPAHGLIHEACRYRMRVAAEPASAGRPAALRDRAKGRARNRERSAPRARARRSGRAFAWVPGERWFPCPRRSSTRAPRRGPPSARAAARAGAQARTASTGSATSRCCTAASSSASSRTRDLHLIETLRDVDPEKVLVEGHVVDGLHDLATQASLDEVKMREMAAPPSTAAP